MEDQGGIFGGEGEAEGNPTLLLEDRDDAFLNHNANVPVGVLSVHVFGCQHLIMNGDSVPDSYQLYGKVSVGPLAKNTSVTTQTKRGKIIWNEILNFPVAIVSQMKDWSNQAVFSVLGYNHENEKKHKLIGKVAFHIHKLVKIGWSMDKYELTNRKKQKTGNAELEFAFSYGTFGYGFSDQLENLVHSPEEVLRQSMFPRVHPREDNTFSKWCLLKPKTVPHPNYIPFSEKVIDLKPDIYTEDEDTIVFADVENQQFIKDSLPRMVKLRNEYLEQAGRTQRVKYLRNLIHGQVTHSVEGDSESSEDEDVGSYVPAGLAAMLSGAARATIKQTIPGVTIRSRADYKNLKVAISMESMTDDNASAAASNTDMNELELPSTSFAKHLEYQGGLSPLQEQIADKVPPMRLTTPSPQSSQDEVDISQDAPPKGSKTMIQRLREKFKEMGHGSRSEEN